MNRHIDEARLRLASARHTYHDLLTTVDRSLQRAVAQDPANLTDAKALQGEYWIPSKPAELKAHVQPTAGESDPAPSTEVAASNDYPSTPAATAPAEPNWTVGGTVPREGDRP
jgi:hypothetical protein